MHSLPSRRLGALYTSATIAFRLSDRMRLRNTPCGPSKVFPCQTKCVTTSASSGVKTVPGAMIAVPFAGPSGIGPLSADRNRSSSCDCVMDRSVGTSVTIQVLSKRFELLGDDRSRFLAKPPGLSIAFRLRAARLRVGIGKNHVRRFLGDQVHSGGDEESWNARKDRRIDDA